MIDNNFIWVDLSSYDTKKTSEFYQKVFKWYYIEEGGYMTATYQNTEICGLYETPDFFKEIKMPHFWMGYIQVENVEETVKKAKDLGGIIEIEKAEFYGGNIALIRDPLGSGFTIYDGNKLNSKTNKENHYMFNELHISDINKIKNFYEGIFDWKIKNVGNDTYNILNNSGERVGDILEIDNIYKLKYEYWVATFGVKNLKEKLNLITELGGEIVSDEGSRVLVTDNSKEAFFYIKEL